MLHKLFVLLFVSILCSSVSYAGGEPQYSAPSATPTDEKLSTDSPNVVLAPNRCTQYWRYGHSDWHNWFDMGDNGGGGRDAWCVDAGALCRRYDWRTVHPIGYIPSDGECEVAFGHKKVLEAGIQMGEDLSGLSLPEYEEVWTEE